AVGPWPFRALLQAVAERALAHAHLPGDLPDRGAFVHHVRCDHDLPLSQFGHLGPPGGRSSRRVPNSPNSARGGCVKLGVSRGARWRDSLQAVLEEILEAELSAHLGAARSERTASRRGYRNGSYGRRLRTRVGEIELRVPRERAGTFRPGVFERYRMSTSVEI